MAINNPNQPQQRKLGTGFTNLQNIMQANTGNRLGQAVSSGIQQTGQQAQNVLKSGVEDFSKQSQENALGTQEQKKNVQDVLGNAGDVSDKNVSDFAKYRAGQYSGPTDIANISNIQNQARQAQQQGQQVGTSGGRQTLLQQYAAAPGTSYNSGQQNLDTLLLGTTGGKQLQQARQAVSGLTNQVQNAQTTAQQQAQQLQSQAQGFGKQVTGQVQGAQSAIYNPAQQAAQQANVAEQQGSAAAEAARMAAQNNQLSADALNALGLQAGQRTYGVNLGEYLGYNPQNEQATAFNVMKQPEFQKYSNLQKLMGQTPQAAPQNPYEAGKATFNQEGAKQAISANQAKLAPLTEAIQKAQADLQKAQTVYQSGFANGMGNTFRPLVMDAYDRLAKAQQAYTNLDNQMSGTISATDNSNPIQAGMENTSTIR